MAKIGILVKQRKIYYLYKRLIFSSLHFFYLLLFSGGRFPYRLPKKDFLSEVFFLFSYYFAEIIVIGSVCTVTAL